MEVSITGRGFHPSEQIKSYAQTKAERLARLFDGIQSVSFTFSREGDSQHAELIVQAARKTRLVAHESSTDMMAAIDRVVDKARRQLRRFKDKLKDRRELRRP